MGLCREVEFDGVMSTSPTPRARGGPDRRVVTAAVAVLAAGAWWAWMGWDTSHQTDSETGATTAPYAAWQVIGCALTIAVVGAVAARLLPVWVLLPALVVPFVGSWTVTALTADDSGLWVVGLILLTVGMTLATLLVVAAARTLWTVLDSLSPGRS